MRKLFILYLFAYSISFIYAQVSENKKAIQIGDQYQGGIVFYIDSSGKHGLISAPYDQTAEAIKWGKNGNTYAISPNDGKFNTKKILDYHNFTVGAKGKAAVYRCDSLIIEGNSDWYLPAIDELKMMYDKRSIIGNFKSGDYCSSTEYGKNDNYSIHFRKYSSIIYFYNKTSRDYFVRCVRKF